MLSEITNINGCDVFYLEFRNHAHFIALALNSEEFDLSHEQDADYGRMTICTLSEGLYAYIREIDEDDIEPLADRGLFAHSFIRTANEFQNGVRYFEVEIHEDAERENEVAA